MLCSSALLCSALQCHAVAQLRRYVLDPQSSMCMSETHRAMCREGFDSCRSVSERHRAVYIYIYIHICVGVYVCIPPSCQHKCRGQCHGVTVVRPVCSPVCPPLPTPLFFLRWAPARGSRLAAPAALLVPPRCSGFCVILFSFLFFFFSTFAFFFIWDPFCRFISRSCKFHLLVPFFPPQFHSLSASSLPSFSLSSSFLSFPPFLLPFPSVASTVPFMSTTTTKEKTLTKGLVTIDTLGNEFKVPDYSIKTILDAIPKKCYNRVVATSFFYVFRDIFCSIVFGTIAHYSIPLLPNVYLRGVAWLSYAILQSLPYTGLWVMAHECGHQAFSDYGWLNDTVGWVLHSYLLVPYFSWKYSHGKHHKATGHLTRDMVFVPSTAEEFKKKRNVVTLSELSEDAPIVTLWTLLVQQFGGWIWYLLTDVTGQPHPELGDSWYAPFLASHFNPTSPIFEKRDYWFIVLSDIGMLTQFFVLYQWVEHFGYFSVFVHWFLPYIFTNHWLVFITYLQHSDVTLPHYEDREWNFARGAAATIDREFGFIGEFFFHDIIETHVLHHYVSRIPFYNGRIGTKALKEVMGEHYAHSDENMWASLWNSARHCQFVEGDNGVKMFRNINGLGVAPKST